MPGSKKPVTKPTPDAAAALFSAKGADAVYDAVLAQLRKRLGPRQVVVDPKQTCVHLTAGEGGTAYAGLHPRKGAVLLNIRLTKAPKSARIRKVEQISANRVHCELLLSTPAEARAGEVLQWLEEACELAGTPKTQ